MARMRIKALLRPARFFKEGNGSQVFRKSVAQRDIELQNIAV